MDIKRIRGLKALVHDAVDLSTFLVREGHESVSRAVLRITNHIEPLAGPASTVDAARRLSTDVVLGTIRLVNRGVETVTDLGFDVAQRAMEAQREAGDHPMLQRAVPMRSDAMKSGEWAGDAALGLVNGVVGDHLRRHENGLDLGMVLRVGDYYVANERDAIAEAFERSGLRATRRVAVFVHGLGTTEWSWCLEAEAYHGDPSATFGSLLARDLDITPLWIRYNTGRHVSENGRALSLLLEACMGAYPLAIEELILIGHSMGGLVVRSACHYGSENGASWVGRVRHVFSLGSPHQGAPLEKAGNLLAGLLGAVDLPGTLIPARILEGRSAGIKDLRHGSLVDEDWLGRDPDALGDDGRHEVPLLPGVTYHFISATVTSDPEHPLGQIVGDLLVRVPSASGPGGAVAEEHRFAIETARFGGVLHHQLQNHPALYAVIHKALLRA